jgi:hypothetical protein
MLVARTQERESLTTIGVKWWKEWQWTGQALQIRCLYRMPDGRIIGKWMDWQSGGSLKAAIRKGIGDTLFFEAESLCKEHSEAVKQRRSEIAAKKRLQAAQEALEKFKRTENRLFAKRHGHKTGEEYDRAFARTQKRLKPEYDRLVAAIEEARTHLEKLLA